MREGGDIWAYTTSGMNSDSFQHLSNYILQELCTCNDALALAGLYLISKTCASVAISVVDLVKTHVISKASPQNLVELYGGQWAGE